MSSSRFFEATVAMAARQGEISRQERRHGRASNQADIERRLRACACDWLGVARGNHGGLWLAAGATCGGKFVERAVCAAGNLGASPGLPLG